MSDELLLNPKYWRARAEEARTMAERMNDATAQDTMLQIARGYDELAALSDRRKAKAAT